MYRLRMSQLPERVSSVHFPCDCFVCFWVGVGNLDVEILGMVMVVCVVLGFEASTLRTKWMLFFLFGCGFDEVKQI